MHSEYGELHACGGVMAKCAECKKQFFMTNPELWAYQRRPYAMCKIKKFCSWHCLQAFDKKHPKPRRKIDQKWDEGY